jgi:hypothetical protein
MSFRSTLRLNGRHSRESQYGTVSTLATRFQHVPPTMVASRSLIDCILLTPADQGLKAKIFGDFVKRARFTQQPDTKAQNTGFQRDPALLSMVAGTRNCLDLLLRASLVPIPT